MSQTNLSEQDQAFYNDGYQLGKQAMLKTGEKSLFESIKSMYQGIDDLIEALSQMALRQGINIDCKKGCAWCCKQAVFANSYEVHYLGKYIVENFSSEEKEKITNKATSKHEKTKDLNEQDGYNFKGDCPLLKNGSCSAYEARPMACRIYLSQKVSSCIQYYKTPEDESNYPALLDFPLQAGKMMNEGFTDALKEGGTFTAEFKLEDGLRRFLNQG